MMAMETFNLLFPFYNTAIESSKDGGKNVMGEKKKDFVEIPGIEGINHSRRKY